MGPRTQCPFLTKLGAPHLPQEGQHGARLHSKPSSPLLGARRLASQLP